MYHDLQREREMMIMIMGEKKEIEKQRAAALFEYLNRSRLN
jgi:hypothetical protein